MLDEQQIQFMEQEYCILVNEQDEPQGRESKKFCHLLTNINQSDNRALHRAFSVFLFNADGKLLLQQRAHDKITFPLYWTNTCCSHPLDNFEAEKLSVAQQKQTNSTQPLGVAVAAIRKLEHELGIEPKDLDVSKFKFMTRILYKAPFDQTWGEHEVDYCLVYQCDNNDLPMKLNYNEVEDVKYVTQEELKSMMSDSKLIFTPWFKLICERFLYNWWNHVLEKKSLDPFVDDKVHNLQ